MSDLHGHAASLPDPASFWGRVPHPTEIEEMREKYLALERLTQLPDDAARKRALRSVARSWPGALREAELVSPKRILARMVLAQQLSTDLTRAQWREEGAAAVVLWAQLHAMLSDQLDARRRRRSAAVDKGRPLHVDEFLGAVPAVAHARWPEARVLSRLCGDVVRPRQAYLWLAARAGLSLPHLHRELFARSGHWDRREGDPAWAHPPDLDQSP